jgi:thiol-disulfide isomerase/thioredoxin
VASLPAAGAENDGRLGLRYQVIEEGLLVTSVSEGMGALEAGVVPGSILLAADGTPLRGEPKDARRLLIGPAGTSVELQLLPPLSSEPTSLSVQRKLPAGTAPRASGPRPAVVRAYRRAVRDDSRRKAVAAAQALVAKDFGGMAPREAIGASLATLMRRGDRFAREVALVLATDSLDDPFLLQGLARVLLQTGEPERAKALLERRSGLVEADLQLADGATTADVGGGFQARALHIDASMQVGDRDTATAMARSLLTTHRDPTVAGLVGLADSEPSVQWTAVLPPVPDFTVPLLNGNTWSSAEHKGEVVVVNFWATWCGPCKRELPELAELYRKRKDEGVEVIAVSTDQGEVEPVRDMADKLELPFTVGQKPELAETFSVGALPAIRVLGADGALYYSARGFSAGAMEKLDHAIDQALEGGREGGAPLATVFGPSADKLVLEQFYPVAGAVGVTAWDAGIAVGGVGASPTVFALDGTLTGEASVETTRGQPGARLGWLDGVVGADPGHLLVRKWDADGLSAWVKALPEPVLDLVTSSDAVWVAAAEHLYVFDSSGSLLHTEAVSLTDLAATPDGVVGVGTDTRIVGRVERTAPAVAPDAEPSGEPSPESPAEPTPVAAPAPPVVVVERSESGFPALVVSEDGDLASDTARYMVAGTFGPGGARRIAIVRGDDRLVIVDDSGQVEVVAELRRGGPLAVVDFNGDGHDSLLVTIPDHGVARLRYQSP